MASTIQVRKGDELDVIIEFRDLAGRLRTDTFSGLEDLTARLWPGDDRAAIPDVLEIDWEDAAGGLAALTAESSATAALARGTYRADVQIEGQPGWEGWLEVLGAPGSAAAPPAYGSLDGMMGLGGEWLARLQGEAAQAGYAEELGAAYRWTHRQALARARSLFGDYSGGYTGSPDAADLIAATDDAEGTIGSTGWIEDRLAIVRETLADGGLMVDADDPDGAAIVEANEHYAVARVLGRSLANKDDSARLAERAAWHRAEANRLLSAVTYRVDDDEDGEADYSLGPG